MCVREVRPGGQRPPVVFGQLRRRLAGLQVQVFEDVDLSFDADLQTGSRVLNLSSWEAAVTSSPAYLCRWALQRVVVEHDGLQLHEASVTDGDGGHFVAGEVQTHQRKLGQL